MSRVRSKNTWPELQLCIELNKLVLHYGTHFQHLPGMPDIAFENAGKVILFHSDFWHGFRFQLWKHKMSEIWDIETADKCFKV